MNKYFNIIRDVSLFRGIGERELNSLLDCLNYEIKAVSKGEVILLAGDKPLYIGITLSGLLHVVKDDYDGNRTLVAPVASCDLFGEAVCYAGVEESPVTVFAAEDSTIMLLRYERVTRICRNTCGYHIKLIENMLRLVADRNLYLQNRLEIISIKSIRVKVLHYLESLAAVQGSSVPGRDIQGGIAVPFNQTKLAEYLCVDRSALAHELSRMKRDNLIDYRKNIFYITGTGGRV